MASATGSDDDYYDTESSYPGVDSDVESNFSTLPVHGHLESQHRADTQSAPEDSQASQEAGTKAREVSQSAAAPSASSPRHTQPAWSEIDASLSTTEPPPPPDYEAATASRPYGRPLHHRTNTDHTWRTNHVLFQAVPGSLPHTAAASQYQPRPSRPQSMSDPTLAGRHRPDEETGLLTGVERQKRQHNWLFCLKKLSICNVVLVTFVVVIVLLVLGTSGSANESDDKGDPDKGGLSPSDPPSPALPPEASIPSSRDCPYEHYSETTLFKFVNVKNFSFVELMESSDWISGGIKGTVNVQPGLQHQREDLRLSLTYATTKPWMWLASNVDQSDDSLMLRLPDLQKTHAGHSARPCMWVYVKIEVRPGVRVDEWGLVAGNLDIHTEDGLFSSAEDTEDLSVLEIGGSSTLSAIRGNVEAAYWSSRETRIDVISGSIKGVFALRDLLSLKSQSGSIEVDVDPKKADPDHTKPAEYIVQSRSGSIKTRFPSTGDTPQRVYVTRVEGQTGSISGSYVLGTLTSFSSASGSIILDLLPKFDREQPSSLHTVTRSGHTKLNVLAPDDYPGEPWSEAHTSHKTTSTSGSIDIVYPQEWSGWIEGETISGSISVGGRDVEIVLDEHRGPIYRHLVARKGVDGQGSIGLKSTSGSLKVRVGDL